MAAMWKPPCMGFGPYLAVFGCHGMPQNYIASICFDLYWLRMIYRTYLAWSLSFILGDPIAQVVWIPLVAHKLTYSSLFSLRKQPAGIWTEVSCGIVEILGVLGCSCPNHKSQEEIDEAFQSAVVEVEIPWNGWRISVSSGKKNWSCYHVRPEKIKWLDVDPHETGTSAMSGAGPILMILWKEMARFNLFFWGLLRPWSKMEPSSWPTVRSQRHCQEIWTLNKNKPMLVMFVFLIIEPLGNKYVLLQLMCPDLRGFLSQ